MRDEPVKGSISPPQPFNVDLLCPSCQRRTLLNKREGHYFCPICCRAFNLTLRAQIENWAWRWLPDKHYYLKIF